MAEFPSHPLVAVRLFRLPEGLLAWLRGQAATEKPVTMTDILVRALEAERDRCDGAGHGRQRCPLGCVIESH